MFLAMFDSSSAAKKSPSVPLFEKGTLGQGCRLLYEMTGRQEFFPSLEKAGLGEIFDYSDNRRITS